MDIKSMTLDELKDACQQMGESRSVPNSYTTGCIIVWRAATMR